MKHFFKALMGTALLCLFHANASADLVVSNLGEPSGGSGGNPFMAMGFTTDNNSYTLNSITTPLGVLCIGCSVNVTAELFNDVGGLPGSKVTNGDLGSMNLAGFATMDRIWNPVSGTISLSANSTYWMVLSSVASNDSSGTALWKDVNTTNETSPAPYSWTITDNRAYFDAGVWATSPTIHALAVDATASGAPVPLPASAWLFVAGLAGMARMARRKSH